MHSTTHSRTPAADNECAVVLYQFWLVRSPALPLQFWVYSIIRGLFILKPWLHIFLVMMKVFKWFCHTGGLFLIQN